MNLRLFAFLFAAIPSRSSPARLRSRNRDPIQLRTTRIWKSPPRRVPARPTAPKNTVPGPAPSPAPAGTESKPPAAEPPAKAAEVAPPAAEPVPATTPAEKAAGETRPETAPEPEPKLTNLERVAYARPVPKDLTIGGYIPGAVRALRTSPRISCSPDGTPLNSDRFLVRRARLRARSRLGVRGGHARARGQHRPADLSVGIRRAGGRAPLPRRQTRTTRLPLDHAERAGVTDLPFGFELAESSRSATPSWSVRSPRRALFPTEADVGAKLSGPIGFVRYGVAGAPMVSLSTRERAASKDPNSGQRHHRSRRRWTSRSRLAIPASLGGASLLSERASTPGTEATKRGVVWRDLDEDRVVDAGEILACADVAETPVRRTSIAGRSGSDLGVSFEDLTRPHSRLYGEVYVGQGYDRGFLPSDPVTGGVDVRQAGGYAALVQDITSTASPASSYAVYDPNSDLIEGRADEFYPKDAGQSRPTRCSDRGRASRIARSSSFEYDFVHDYLGARRDGRTERRGQRPVDACACRWTS